MIVCDDTDLFGGRVSIISTHGFCCQVETAGERLGFAPLMVIHDLPGDDESNPARLAASLHYRIKSSVDGLLARHQAVVEFLDLLAKSDRRMSLASALEIASREFTHFGDWRWPDGSILEFGSETPTPIFYRTPFQDGEISVTAPVVAPRNSWRPHSHADSPLAD